LLLFSQEQETKSGKFPTHETAFTLVRKNCPLSQLLAKRKAKIGRHAAVGFLLSSMPNQRLLSSRREMKGDRLPSRAKSPRQQYGLPNWPMLAYPLLPLIWRQVSFVEKMKEALERLTR
jgi:hypothetical protein